MSYNMPESTQEEYEVDSIIGRRPTEQGFQYLIRWIEDGKFTYSAEYAFYLESSDPDFWLPLLDAFDNAYPRGVVGDWRLVD
jgi:hypothetical protein